MMKLIIAIVGDDVAYEIIKELSVHKIRATKLSSSGGFWEKGNTTLLIGENEESLQETLNIIKDISKSHPVKNKDVANANIFIINMRDYFRF